MRAANYDLRAIDARLDAAPGALGEIFRLGERHAGLFGELGQRLCRGVVAVFLRGRGKPQEFGRLGFAQRRETADRQASGRERAGLVENEGVDPRREFDVADVFDQDAEPRGGGERDHHGRRRSQNERARTGHDQDGDDAIQIPREGPDQRAQHKHQRGVKDHVLIDDPHDRQLGLLGSEDEFAHTAKRRVLPGTRDFHFEDAGEILRAGEHLVARLLIDRQRFAGDVGLIE